MGQTYSISENTAAPGDTITNITPDKVNKICERQCRCLCDTNENCVGFTHSDAAGCHLKKNIPFTVPEINTRTYVKGGRSNYYILWVFLGIVCLLIFLGKSSRYNAGNTAYYTYEF